jgi:hypothetical protein
MDRTDVSQIGWGTYEESLFGNRVEGLNVFSFCHRKSKRVDGIRDRMRLIDV